MKYYNYSLYEYEVWGNKHDDFQVEAGGFCPAFELRCDKIIDTEG